MTGHGMDENDPDVSRAYREAAHPGPGPALDAKILAAARATVARPKPRRGLWRRLAVPVSAIAAAVVATTLAVLMEQETQRMPTVRQPASESAPSTAAEPTAPTADRAEMPAAGEAGALMRQSPPVPQPTPAAAPPRAPARGETEAPAAAPAPAETFAGRPGPEAGAMEKPAGKPAPPESTGGATAESMPEPAGDAAGTMREESRIGVRALGKAVAGGPEALVERIRQLRQAGRQAEARSLLEELQRRYPDFTLPEDLR
jgi:hypothetical protein